MKPPEPLTEKQKRKLIKVVWEQIKSFIRDWQKYPYEYNSERDIQSEIVNRIMREYKRLGLSKVYAEYKKFWWLLNGYEKQYYNRIWCEPKIYCLLDNGKRSWTYPDIVIFDDLKDYKSPPDVDSKGRTTKINWPMLWVCEIKYKPEWSSKRNNKKSNWDLDKIRYLLAQPDGTEYACWLDIYRERAKSGSGIEIKLSKEGRLRKYYVTLPALKH